MGVPFLKLPAIRQPWFVLRILYRCLRVGISWGLLIRIRKGSALHLFGIHIDLHLTRYEVLKFSIHDIF